MTLYGNEHQHESKTEFETMIDRINDGDVAALDEYKGWDIFKAHCAGRLRAPKSIEYALQIKLDIYRESL